MLEFSISLTDLKKAVADLEIAHKGGFNDSVACFALTALGNGCINQIRASYVCPLPAVRLERKKGIYENRWSRCDTDWLVNHKFDKRYRRCISLREDSQMQLFYNK